MTKNGNGQTNETKTENFVRDLRVKLTDQEVADRADRAAEVFAERDAIEENLKAYAKPRVERMLAVQPEARA